jgi:hypothetical protein
METIVGIIVIAAVVYFGWKMIGKKETLAETVADLKSAEKAEVTKVETAVETVAKAEVAKVEKTAKSKIAAAESAVVKKAGRPKKTS